MTFKEVVSNTNWIDVKTSFLTHYENKYLQGVEKVFSELSKLKALDDPDDKISELIIIKNYDEIENEYSYDVYGIKENDPIHYGLDFVKWEYWLSYPLSTETLNTFTASEITAHCIWEMTFWGWDQAKIKKKGKRILKVKKSKKLYSYDPETGKSELVKNGHNIFKSIIKIFWKNK